MLCFVLLIAYFVIPVYRADAATGTVSPMSSETALATFGQSFPGTYKTGNSPTSYSATTWEYYDTLDLTSVKTQSPTLSYYQNLNCKMLLYRADVSGLVSSWTGEYNLSALIDTSFANCSSLRFMCGFSTSVSGGPMPTAAVISLDYTLNSTGQNVQAIHDNGYYATLLLYYDSANQDINHSCYVSECDLSYTGDSSSVGFVQAFGSSNPQFVDSKYVFFYIITPVTNDDIIISGESPEGDTADIYDYLSNTLHDMMQSNAGLLQSIYNFIVTIPDAILEGLHDLFIPSQEDLEDFKDDIDDLLHNTFGGLYDAEDTIHDSLSNISSGSVSTIHFPGISVVGFTLPAQEVPIKPEGMGVLFDTLAIAIDIICTFAFLNMMKDKLHKLFSKDDGGD